jgi:hypothetical protein
LWWIRPQSGRHAIRIESHILQGPSSRLMACMYLGVYQKKSLKSLSLSLFLSLRHVLYNTWLLCVCVWVWIASFFLLIFSPTLFSFSSSSSSFIAGRSSFFLPFLMSSKKLCRVPAGTERNDVSFLLLLLLFYFPVIFLFFSFCVSVSLFPFCFVFRIQR